MFLNMEWKRKKDSLEVRVKCRNEYKPFLFFIVRTSGKCKIFISYHIFNTNKNEFIN